MRRFLPALLVLPLLACSGHGAEGVPTPPPMDMSRIVRPATPNTALAAPAGFVPAPDIVTRRYDVPPAALYAAVRRVAAGQPRTFLAIAYDQRMQAHYVARSRVFNFPDLIAVQVNPDGTLVLWSRSVYGRSDFGVNRARLERWLAALDAALSRPAPGGPT
jgi:uncharacterized protein (DUF1499 family)